MERLNNAHIKPGSRYDKLFRQPNWKDTIIKRSADLADTLELIPKVVKETKADTVKIGKLLKGKTKLETCRNIWHFVYDHIPYRRDEKGKEQIRRPSRSWFERKTRKDGSPGGVDCDCYTVFISSILSNLGINHSLRVTKNNKDYFQHIYPIVPTTKGKHLTLDCVVDTFNYEAPYKEKIDKPMELHYLSGLDDEVLDDELLDDPFYDEANDVLDYTINGNNLDATDFINGLSEQELGFLRKLRRRVGRGIKKFGRKVGKVAKKAVHVINKINPATLLLRNGLLLAMKLNMMKVAERIKYAYLSEADARRKGLDISKYRRLVSAKNRLEKIFHGAGGRTSNLRKAILSGKGNRGREVRGLGDLGEVFDGGNYDENSSIREILGEELYHEEFAGDFQEIEGFEDLQGELGEIATGTALAAASGAVAAISKLLDRIGDIKKKATSVVRNTPFTRNRTTRISRPRPTVRTSRSSTSTRVLPAPRFLPTSITRKPTVVRRSSTLTPTRQTTQTLVPSSQTTHSQAQTGRSFDSQNTPTSSSTNDENKGLMHWMKENPVKAGAAGLGLVAVGYGVYRLAQPTKKTVKGLAGNGKKRKKTVGKKANTSKPRKTSRAKAKSKTTRRTSQKKVAIALM